LTFPSETLVVNQPTNYNEDSERFLVKYAFTDKTSLDGYVGYLRRTYPNSSFGAYGGGVGRATFTWQLTGKTQIAFGGWRELHAYIDAESDYFVAKGYSVAPSWQATEKLSFSLMGQHEDQDYIGSSTSVITLGERHDRINSGLLSAHYTPRDPLVIVLTVRRDVRESNQYLFSYNDSLANLSATYKFR
jgi:hypothetical protein